MTQDGFVDGSVSIEDGVVVEISKKKSADPASMGVVLPAFCNAHTHLGDAFIRIELTGTVEELVAPPHGLKHRLLEKASEHEVVSGISGAVESMLHGGTATFWDFRETGVEGVRMLYKACLGNAVEPICLGRPKKLAYDDDEVNSLLRVSDGLGVSSMRDWDYSELQKLSTAARRAGKTFATHCSEVVREDIDKVLDLKPDFLVHMLTATGSDLERCADAGVPIVVCPRSNAFFGKLPNIPFMMSKGVTLLLGTDNAMLNSPSMLAEIDFAFRAAKLKGHASPSDIVGMAIRGRKGLSEHANFGVRIGDTARLAVLDVPAGADPYSAVLRATDADVALVWLGEKRWQRQRKEQQERRPRKSQPARRKGSPRGSRGRRISRPKT